MSSYSGDDDLFPREGNPFEITKAVDFTDREIDQLWVDWPAPGGFAEFINIRSPMPRIFLGGKGTGRTHLMRRFSAPVQVIRGNTNPIEQVLNDGVLGIYVLCSGLNSSRFRGRGQHDEFWQSAFAQYVDLWLAQAALAAFGTVSSTNPPTQDAERSIVDAIQHLLHGVDGQRADSLVDLQNGLFLAQREIDLAINNAALHREIPVDLTIRSNRGDLVFGIPAAIQECYAPLRDVRFLYLIDEFENFDAPQQEYINSLIREKKAGSSFVVGVRTYGLKTLATLGGQEENRIGSEYEEVRLDENYIGSGKDTFGDFCRLMVGRRLSDFGLMENSTPDELGDRLAEFFEVPDADYEEQQIIRRYPERERPYLTRLNHDLLEHRRSWSETPIRQKDVDFVVDAVRIPSRPLLEKANCLLIYRAWAEGADLIQTAQEILDTRPSADGSRLIGPNAAQQSILDHYRTDLLAQLCDDRRGQVLYSGMDQFITMSGGLPRNLLVILKNVHRWAIFNGEKPFTDHKISLDAQLKGVRDATEWFFSDAKPLGEDGKHVHNAIAQLGNMLRLFRFSNKPVESSLSSFSLDLSRCSVRTREVIDLAEKWALLVRIDPGQKHRNSGLIEEKFQLNPLLSPRWDLPTARRGVIALRFDEADAIFDPERREVFPIVLNDRLARMNVPFRSRPGHHPSQQAFDWDTHRDGAD